MSKARHARPRRSSRRMVRTLSIAGLGAGIAAAGAGAAFASDYTVKSGDTLSEIAQAKGADWHQVAELNHLQNPNLILVGQTLQLDGAKKSGVVTIAAAPKTAVQKSRVSRSKTSRATLTSARVALSGAWSQVANCESSGNPRAVNPSNHQGLFQFDLQTWRSVGGTGQPINASPAEQLKRAKMLYAQRGSEPWPDCGRYLR
jgi:murein DD-endopeptidase MepM/ murein hydrolase activator NlpD